MRFDIVSVFPEFFEVLNLSLVGKARERGILTVASHDLRDWTDDPHRTVDDTPAGGGAGMVMRPDIWGLALDELLGDGAAQEGTVLAIPTPSGERLTQRMCEDLASAEHIVIACGRYEGIDSRVAREYAARGVRVVEYSLGDYVLNGGEVAAVALVEAVGRLVPGMVGNPESLVEESHGAAGLLEYPVFTRPTQWRGQEIPAIVTSGDHGAVARWRRDRALELTASRRPDMIEALSASSLDKKDKRKLGELGYLVLPQADHPLRPTVRRACEEDLRSVASLATRTFPDACPPQVTQEAIADFVANNLTEDAFRGHLADPEALVVVLDVDGTIGGYSLTFLPSTEDGVARREEGAPVDVVIDDRPRRGPMAYLSKFYLDRSLRGTAAKVLLWAGTLREMNEWTSRWQEPYIWLGTHTGNRRAQKAYAALGFVPAGKRHFLVGDVDNVDRVFARRIRMA